MKYNLFLLLIIIASCAQLDLSNSDETVTYPELNEILKGKKAGSQKWVRHDFKSLGKYKVKASPTALNTQEQNLCILFELKLREEDKKSGYLNQWKATVNDSDNRDFDLQWTDESYMKPPKVTSISSYKGIDQAVHHEAIACTKMPLELKNGFKVELKSKLVNDLLNKGFSFKWSFLETEEREMISSNEEVIMKITPQKMGQETGKGKKEEKPQNKSPIRRLKDPTQPYRGW
jgi:hypothetical protein